MFEIQKNVAIPESRGNYPFAVMEVGDSFAFDAHKRPTVASSITSFCRKNPGWQFTTKKEGSRVRCWRTA